MVMYYTRFTDDLGSVEGDNVMTIHEKLDKILEVSSSISKVYYLGNGTSFDLKPLFPNEYMNFTSNNFILTVTRLNASSRSTHAMDRDGYTSSATSTPSVSYNNGVATIINSSCSANSGLIACDGSLECGLYLVIGGLSVPSV